MRTAPARPSPRAKVDGLMAMIERFARDYIDMPYLDAARDQIREAIVNVAVDAAEDVALAIQARIPGDAHDVAGAKVQGAWRDAARVALDQATKLSDL